MNRILLITIIIALASNLFAQKNESQTAVAFYNLENLFDTLDAPIKGDFAWTPGGGKIWNTERYNKKLHNLAYVIEKLDADTTLPGPDVLGVCEVENRSVLEDLIQTPPIDEAGYGIVHYNSPDHRGIDVGLLYRKDRFEVTNSRPVTLHFPDEDYHTRDQLVVSGKLAGEKVHFIVNHWPSRRGGPEKSEYRRLAAARLCKSIADSIRNVDPESAIIIMGDFNDDPDNRSITEILKATPSRDQLSQFDYWNPVAQHFTESIGSLCYRDQWYLFDQVLLSKPLMDDKGLSYEKSDIYNDRHIRVKSGKYKDHPLRTHAGTLYLKGYSDHFPVYVIFE